MAVNTVHIDRTPEQVFEVLADGWKFTNWVVGTSHMRAVTADWPAAGAKLHHAFGSWPVMRRDETVVDSVVPNERLELTATGRPFGQARIVIELTASNGGCDVTMTETVVAGPLQAAHNRLTDLLLGKRNAESLARFRALVERPTEPVEGSR